MARTETPTALAHIDLINLRLSEVELNALQLLGIRRITEEQCNRIIEAKKGLGKIIEDILAEPQEK